MQSLQNIQQLIDQNRYDEARSLLDIYLKAHPENDEAHFMSGRLHWCVQRYGDAVTAFETAVSLNPQSGAVHALELARDVFNFYNPDMLNP